MQGQYYCDKVCLYFLSFFECKLTYFFIIAYRNSLNNNKITSEGAKVLCPFLASCKSLKIIHLFQNPLGDDCMFDMGEMVNNSSSINQLWLGMDRSEKVSLITDNGIEDLVSSLMGNSTLNILTIPASIHITDKCVPSLVDLVNSTKISNAGCLGHLLIGENIDQSLKEQLKICLKSPVNERNIPLKSKTKSAAKIA